MQPQSCIRGADIEVLHLKRYVVKLFLRRCFSIFDNSKSLLISLSFLECEALSSIRGADIKVIVRNKRYWIQTRYVVLILHYRCFFFFDNTIIQIFVFLLLLGIDALSSLWSAEIRGIQSKQGMLYDLFIIVASFFRCQHFYSYLISLLLTGGKALSSKCRGYYIETRYVV